MGTPRSPRDRGMQRPTLTPPGVRGLDLFMDRDLVDGDRLSDARNVRTQRGGISRRKGERKIHRFPVRAESEGARALGSPNWFYAPHREAHHFGVGCWFVLVHFTAVRPLANPANHYGAFVAGLEILDGTHSVPWSIEIRDDGQVRGQFSTHLSGGATRREVFAATTAAQLVRYLLFWDPVTNGGQLECYVDGVLQDTDLGTAQDKPHYKPAAQLLVGAAATAVPGSPELDAQFGGSIDSLVGVWHPGIDPTALAPNGLSLKDTVLRWHTQDWPNAEEASFHYGFDDAAAGDPYLRDESPYLADLTEVGSGAAAAQLSKPCALGGHVGHYTKTDTSEEVIVFVGGDFHVQKLRSS